MADKPFRHGSFGSPQQSTAPIVSTPAPEERQWLIDPDGFARTLPAHQVEQAQQQGYRLPANADEIAKARERERVADEATQGVMGSVNAFVEGAARAIPGVDWVARKGNELLLGKEQADLVNEAVKARSKTDAATAGEVVGTLGLALGTGGASVGARTGAKAGQSLLSKVAANNPVALFGRGAEAAGKAAEKLVTKAVPSEALGKILSKGAALGTEGALQGAVVQAGHNINEAALGDHELTAEKLLASVPEAALFGGGLGAALGVPIGAARAAAGKVANTFVPSRVPAVIDDVARAARPTAAQRAAEKSLKQTALDHTLDGLEIVAEVATKGRTGSVKGAMASHTGLLDAAAAGLSKAQGAPVGRVRQSILDHAIDGFSNVSSVASGKRAGDIKQALKNRSARLDAVNYDELQNEARSRLSKSISGVRSQRAVEELLDSDALDVGAASQVRQSPDVLVAARGKLDEIAARVEGVGPGAEAVRPLLESARKRVAAAAPGAEADAFRAIEELRRGVAKARDSADDEIGQELASAIERDTSTFLTEPAVWGPAATTHQRARDALLEYRDSKAAFDDLFLTRAKAGARAVDEGKLAQYLETVEDWQTNGSLQSAVRHLDARVAALQTLDELSAAPQITTQLRAAKQQAETLRAELQTTSERLGNAKAVRKLAQSDDPLRTFAAAIGGSLIGGPVGFVAGVGMSALANPGGMVNRVIQIEALAQQLGRFDRSAQRGMRAFVRSAGDKSAQALPRRARIAGAARQAAVTAALPDYSKRAKQIQEMASNPELAVQSTARLTEGLDQTAPKLTQAVTAAHQRTIAYLDSLIARPPATIRSPERRAAWKPPPADVIKFERSYRAITKPQTVLEDLQDGSLTLDAVNALKATRPKLWDYYRGVAQMAVAEHQEALDYDAVTRLSIMFDFAGDPTLEPGFIARHQALISQAPAGTGQPDEQAPAPAQNATNIPGIPSAVQTHTEKIAQAL